MSPSSLKEFLLQEVEKKAFAGGIAAIAHSGVVKFKLAFGNSTILPEPEAVTDDTLYDVASLTKPLITALIILYLIQGKLLKADTPLVKIYPECPQDKKDITITNLLCHNSGIIGWYPLYTSGKSIREYATTILSLPVEKARETEVIYSCPNFILLADIIERITSLPFPEAAEEMVIQPLRLKHTFLGSVDRNKYSVAATELDSQTEAKFLKEMGIAYSLRRGLIHGEVHDCNSFSAGGSSGNAGLFCNIEDAVLLMDQFTTRSQFLSYQTRTLLQRNLTPYGPQHRVPGWQLATSPDCSAGDSLSGEAIGHTGFTGPSLWWDPNDDLTYLLFVNRIHPVIQVTDINPIRRKTHEFLKTIWRKHHDK